MFVLFIITFFYWLVFTNEFLNDLIKPCKDLANARAKNSVETGIYQQYIVEKQLNTNKNIDEDSEHIASKVKNFNL